MDSPLARGDIAAMRYALLLAVTLSAPLGAQGIAVGSWLEDYARLSQLTGALPVSPVMARPNAMASLASLAAAATAHPWSGLVGARAPMGFALGGARLELRPAELRAFANSARPWGANDGAVWQGKGLTFAATGGADLRWGPLSITLAPLVTRSANADFTLSPLAVPAELSPYAYPVISGGTLDAPQRFGAEAVERVDWGNSSVSAEWGPVALGFSHESMWWGPGMRNDITMTNNAPGFWHAHLSLVRPVSVGIGTVSGRWIWGSLRESAFFDTTRANDRRYLTGAAISFVPKWAPGVELGASRTFIQTWTASPGIEELLWVFRPLQKQEQATPGNPTGEDGQDQAAAVFARWTLPSAGLELYGEWAKGDHSSNFRDLLVEPEHGSAYLLGLQKVTSHTPERTWRVASEFTILGAPRTTAVRSGGAGFFYLHTRIIQGYTQLGQVMGAGIGPGSSQLSLAVDRFAKWGKAGVSVFRTVYDNDRYYRRPGVSTIGDFYSHEVEPSVTADAMVFRGPWDFTASVTASRLLNRYYIFSNDQMNVNLALGARYHPLASR